MTRHNSTPARKEPCNLVLIGMPGTGKSTVGVILAKVSSRAFVDSDLLIQSAQGRSLQAIIDADGYGGLRRIEEEILLGLTVKKCVVATGGSAVYSEESMRHLKEDGTLIFLDVDLATLEVRVEDFSGRGIAKTPDRPLPNSLPNAAPFINVMRRSPSIVPG